MNDCYIRVPSYLTSYAFYNALLPQCQENIQLGNRNIILDFSETCKVEPLVIPNLLCLGYGIKREHGLPQIYIPDTIYTGALKNYLYGIGFTNFAQKYGLYDFLNCPTDGLRGKKTDPICTTLYFDLKNSIDEIIGNVQYCIAPFADKYLSKFRNMYEYETGIYYANDITEFLAELIVNSKVHARSFSFATMHAKYSTNRIYLAVSDLGYGFLYTVRKMRTCEDEADGILSGIYWRKRSKVYGLYNVIRRVLENNGKVRIHSNDTQIILTPRILSDFLGERLLMNESFRIYNIKRTMLFEGVHIEIELPMERRENFVHYRGRGY